MDTTRANEAFSCSEAWKGGEGTNSYQKYRFGDSPRPLLQRDPEKDMNFRKNTLEASCFYSEASSARCQKFSTAPGRERNKLQADRVQPEPRWRGRPPRHVCVLSSWLKLSPGPYALQDNQRSKRKQPHSSGTIGTALPEDQVPLLASHLQRMLRKEQPVADRRKDFETQL